LGREPTHVELVAAQRAAHRLTEQYQVRIAHVSSGRVTPRGTAVLAREDRRIADEQLVKAASRQLPELREQPLSPGADQLIDGLASALAAATIAACALANPPSRRRVATRSATWWRDCIETLLGFAASSERPGGTSSVSCGPSGLPPWASPNTEHLF
jgi:hypothetical protein